MLIKFKCWFLLILLVVIVGVNIGFKVIVLVFVSWWVILLLVMIGIKFIVVFVFGNMW